MVNAVQLRTTRHAFATHPRNSKVETYNHINCGSSSWTCVTLLNMMKLNVWNLHSLQQYCLANYDRELSIWTLTTYYAVFSCEVVEESTASEFRTVFPYRTQGTNRNNIWFRSDLIFPQAVLASTVATCMWSHTPGLYFGHHAHQGSRVHGT